MDKTVLVTGANGFVGRHLVHHLCQKASHVRALDTHFEKSSFPKGVEKIEGDILDPLLMKEVCEGVSCVFHLAALTALWIKDEKRYQSINVEGTRTILEHAIKAGAKRFIYCSSFVTTIAGGRKPRLIDEHVLIPPKKLFGHYARSKRQAELLVMKSEKIETITVLPSAPLGAGDYNMTAPTCLIRDLVNGNIPALLDQITNFVDVDLLAEAIANTAYLGKNGERYLLTGKNRPILDFLDVLERLTGVSMPRYKVPYPIASAFSCCEEKLICRLTQKPPKAPYAGVRMAGRPFEFDNAKAITELDINLNPLEDALLSSLSWLKRQGHITREMPAMTVSRKELDQ